MFSLRQVRIVAITGFLSLPFFSLAAVAQETNPEQFLSPSQLAVPEAIAPTDGDFTDNYFSAQAQPDDVMQDFGLPNVFIPPQARQMIPTRPNAATNNLSKRGDRPELGQIMRLEPAPFPNFVYE